MNTESSLSRHITGDRPAASAPEGLPDRRELAFIAVERTRMPMIVADARQPDCPIILANHAFLKDTGFPPEEVIGHNCRFLQGPGTDPAAIAQVREAVAAERPITIELLNYRKDGTPFMNQLHISPIFDDDGKLSYFFASQLDVTEQRRVQDLERQERLLLREIEHRAKNALALVQGIVRMSRAASVEDFSDRVQGRVDALAKAHGVLSEVRWQEVPLDRLIRAEVEPFGTLRVRFAGPPVNVAADQVQPLALVLHEVVANAALHGALSNATGTMAIEWRTEPGTTLIELHETGGPAPASQRPRGFGTQMIETIMQRQLRGEVEFDWHPAGLRSRLSVPAREKKAAA